jgi:p-cumate 2,3-dioxygenase subunit alpha
MQYVRDDRDQAMFRVHRAALTDPEVVVEEYRRIFDQVWLYVGHESEIPDRGDFVARTVADRPLILTRDSDGVVHVLLNSCLHRGAEVCRDDRGNSKHFKCFYHAWTYDNTGALVGVPDRAAYPPSFRQEELGLGRPAKVDNYRGFVFASFNADVESLPDYLGNAAPYIDLVADQSPGEMEILPGIHDYSIQANWKLLIENSLDGYHLGPLHKTYFEYLANTGDGRVGKRPTRAYDLGKGHGVIVDRAPWGRTVARWAPSFGEEFKPVIAARRQRLVEAFGEERASAIADEDCNLLVFPNLVINDVMAVVVRTIWPTAADHMEVKAWAFAPKDDDEKIRALTLSSFVSFLGPGGFATPDDMEALESCQRGMKSAREVEWSDMSRGMDRESGHTSADEIQMRSFWRRWSELMQGERDG